MSQLSPVCWNGHVFTHRRSDDICDYFQGDAGRLTHRRATGDWLASIRDAQCVAHPSMHRSLEADNDVARAALNGAVEVLRRRVAADSQWLDALEKELGSGEGGA